MNYAKRIIAAVAVATFAAVSVALCDDVAEPVTFKGQPPWRSNTVYQVTSQYNLILDNIRLEVDILGKWWPKKRKPVGHVTSDPFSVKYFCSLDYSTLKVMKMGEQQGSAFREFSQPSVEFVPEGHPEVCFTKTNTNGWWRDVWRMDAETEMVNIAKAGENADFAYRQVYEPEGRKTAYGNLHMIYWEQNEAFTKESSLSVFKGPHRNTEIDTGFDNRAAISQNQADGWVRCGSSDMPNSVIQAEAKLMSYAIYGNTDTRDEGEAWTVDADILTSFLPAVRPEDQAFSFKGGKLVLMVKDVDRRGIQTIVMVPKATVNGKEETTDLKIVPNISGKYKATYDAPNLANSSENSVIFKVDSRHRICRSGEVRLVLRNYNGALPSVGQMELGGKKKRVIDGHQIDAQIKSGTVTMAAELRTTTSDED